MANYKLSWIKRPYDLPNLSKFSFCGTSRLPARSPLVTGCNLFPLRQPPDVHSQQSHQRNPLWHLHDGPECVCKCVCMCFQRLMKRDSLCQGPSPQPPGVSTPARTEDTFNRLCTHVCAHLTQLLCSWAHAHVRERGRVRAKWDPGLGLSISLCR